MATRLDEELDTLAAELALLDKETTERVRNYSADEAFAMKNGKPRNGAGHHERTTREKFARMREIEAMLNTHHGN